MPYYQWRGVDIVANIHKGHLFAQSPEHLATLLAKREIYLLDAQQKAPRFTFKRITSNDRAAFFRQLATLLEANVHVPEALSLMIEQTNNARFQIILHAVTDAVYQGIPLHTALSRHPHLFSPIVLQLLTAGQESGTMSAACATIALYEEQQAALYNKIRAALLLPGVTFICFIVITLIIFVWLIPRFATIFSSLRVPLPQSTQTLLYISSFITLPFVLGALFFMIFLILLVYKGLKSNRLAPLLSSIILRVPFWGPFLRDRFCLSLFQSLQILINHATSIHNALKILGATEKNSFLKKELIALEKATDAGTTLNIALSRSPYNLFSHTVIAMIAIGEESNNLAFMLEKISAHYQQVIQKKIDILTTFIQPMLMVILGLCIALLISALYIPLFNLSLYVGQ